MRSDLVEFSSVQHETECGALHCNVASLCSPIDTLRKEYTGISDRLNVMTCLRSLQQGIYRVSPRPEVPKPPTAGHSWPVSFQKVTRNALIFDIKYFNNLKNALMFKNIVAKRKLQWRAIYSRPIPESRFLYFYEHLYFLCIALIFHHINADKNHLYYRFYSSL